MEMAGLMLFMPQKIVWFLIYLNMFCNNDDIFGIRNPIWKILQDILDDIHR